jgi:GNAT superfamily N-acetyltransferase
MTPIAHDKRSPVEGTGSVSAWSGLQPGPPATANQENAHGEPVDLAAARRCILGEGTALWSSHGEHAVEPGWWKAISGVRGMNLNMFLCHGVDPELVKRSLDSVPARVPAVIALAGPALNGAQDLNDAGWVCIGASAFMVLEHLEDLDFDSDPEVLEAGPADLPAVWDTLCETLRYTPDMARTAIPRDVFEMPGQSVWTLSVDGRICSSVATVNVDSALVVWSMATLPSAQHRGYGRRLLSTALARAASQGVTQSMLLATPAGVPLYQALGYRVTEYWEQWSRPRWLWAF